jgi:23S rRNA pseudouridine2605 synthase
VQSSINQLITVEILQAMAKREGDRSRGAARNSGNKSSFQKDKKPFSGRSKEDKPGFGKTEKFESKSRGSGGGSKFFGKDKEDRKPGYKKPFTKRDGSSEGRSDFRKDGDSRPSKPFGDRRNDFRRDNDSKPFSDKRSDFRKDGDSRPSKPFGDRRNDFRRDSDSKPFSDKRGDFRKDGDSRPSKPFGDRRNDFRRDSDSKPFSDKRGDFRKDGDSRPSKPFGDRRNDFRRDNDSKPFSDKRGDFRKDGDSRPSKPFGDRRNDFRKDNDSKPFSDRRTNFRKDGDSRNSDSFEKRRGSFKQNDRFSESSFQRNDRGDDSENQREQGEKKVFGRFAKEAKFGRRKEENEEKPGFRKFSRSSEKPENNERQVGMKRPPRYDKEHLEKKAPFRAKEKISKEFRKEEDEEIRLNRYLANSGLCSRREADELIASGMIRVNGKVVTEMGYKVKDEDTVKYGKDVLSRERMMYILLNKPKDFITTMDDPDDRRTVMDLIEGACKERVYPVGRLDRNTTGLLLLTNDGELTEKLTHPSQEVKKIYQAELNKPFAEEHFDALKAGIELEDGFIKPDQLAFVTPDAEVIGIEIHSGKNRIVRRLFEHFGYEVTKLDRTTFAGLNKKELPRGKWRFLTEKEVIMLKYLL